MKIKATKKQFNEFTIEGITLGKILAIKRALEETTNRSTLQNEVLNVINSHEGILRLNN
jgi:hypothetical protein